MYDNRISTGLFATNMLSHIDIDQYVVMLVIQLTITRMFFHSGRKHIFYVYLAHGHAFYIIFVLYVTSSLFLYIKHLHTAIL